MKSIEHKYNIDKVGEALFDLCNKYQIPINDELFKILENLLIVVGWRYEEN